jgi:hypothetical protein
MTYACFKLDALTRSLWRVTFSNPPMSIEPLCKSPQTAAPILERIYKDGTHPPG